MKYLIASDIHGSEKYCSLLAEAFEREKADRFLLLGDFLYHGPRNDLPEKYGPKGVISILEPYKDRTFAVRGNCDAPIDLEVLPFGVFEPELVLKQGEVCVHATHGDIFGEHHLPPMEPGDILLCGHTHVPALTNWGSFVYMNPGSVSIPKGGSSHGYMTWEGAHFEWKTLNGELYRRYDHVKA